MIKGDINNDGIINQKDAELLWKAVLGTIKLSPSQKKAADLNNDNKITKSDLNALNEILRLRISGDANGDVSLTQDDVEIIKKAIGEKLKLDDRLLENADINRDGTLNMHDLVLLQRLIAGIIADYEARRPKNNKITIKLDSFETGEYLSWFVTTQAAYNVHVLLKDDSNPAYIDNSKSTTNIEPPLAVGTRRYTGKNLVLEISIPQSDDIKVIPSMSTIITDSGKIVGHSFTCCGEDWVDGDFNDFYINLVGWKSKH